MTEQAQRLERQHQQEMGCSDMPQPRARSHKGSTMPTLTTHGDIGTRGSGGTRGAPNQGRR